MDDIVEDQYTTRALKPKLPRPVTHEKKAADELLVFREKSMR